MKESKWLILTILTIVWGSSFILIKKGLNGLDPIELGSVRMISASVVMLFFKGKEVKNIPLRKWKYVACSALFGIFFPAYLFAYAQTEIDSTISSMINAITPLLTLIIGAAFFGLIAQRRQFFGVLIGFIGCSLLILTGAAIHSQQNYMYALLAIIACAFYAININWVKKYLSDLTPTQIAMGNFVLLLFLSLIILSTTDFFSHISNSETQTAILYTSVLGVCSTGIASMLFYKLIQISSPVFASSTTYLIPIVAFGWGILDNEGLHYIQVLGALIILIGVYFSGKK
ncbi:MAG TPA: DMT family transporter [Flavobacterium sp.]|nr:DMT family transporter [Flavobacterium sp.]